MSVSLLVYIVFYPVCRDGKIQRKVGIMKSC